MTAESAYQHNHDLAHTVDVIRHQQSADALIAVPYSPLHRSEQPLLPESSDSVRMCGVAEHFLPSG
jgi:hypothetical protein